VEKSNFHLSSREGEDCRQQPGGGVLLFVGAVVLIFFAGVVSVSAREKNATHYGIGLIVNLPYPEAEVVQVVQEVVQNGIIRGTKEYNKDEYLGGAESATTTHAFQPWTEGGKAFYKVRLKALDPWNFKNTNDSGTVAVRYVVQGQDDKHTVLRIDARFVEDFRRVTHPSNGSVEGSEYKDIHDRLEAMALIKTQASEAEKSKESSSSTTQQIDLKDEPATPSPASSAAPVSASDSNPAAAPAAPSTSEQTGLSSPPATPVNLEDRVSQLRQQVERLVKAPGAPLKSAPFHTASTVQSLATGTEVLIVISTPYWFGVETHDGQHGWILRDQLEPRP
jgi:hypothetical protein